MGLRLAVFGYLHLAERNVVEYLSRCSLSTYTHMPRRAGTGRLSAAQMRRWWGRWSVGGPPDRGMARMASLVVRGCLVHYNSARVRRLRQPEPRASDASSLDVDSRSRRVPHAIVLRAVQLRRDYITHKDGCLNRGTSLGTIITNIIIHDRIGRYSRSSWDEA